MRNVAKLMMATMLAATPVSAVFAQQWKAEVAAGKIGEQGDGYLAVVGGDTGLEPSVGQVNIVRKKL